MSRRNALFDIFCVLHSAADIASRAAQIQARNSYLAFRDQIPTKKHQPGTYAESRPHAESRIVESTPNMTEEPDDSLGQSASLSVVAESVVSADTAVETHVDLNTQKNVVQALPLPSQQTRIIERPPYLSDHLMDEPEVIVIMLIPRRILFFC